MEYKVALENLKFWKKYYVPNNNMGELIKRVYEVAIEALEKQTQKKPSYYGEEDDGKILCPYCETDLYDDRECGFNNCPYCGQAINWEGVKEE